jgi:hypothetical protein
MAIVDPERFGLTADELQHALTFENIMARRFSIPVHRMTCYAANAGAIRFRHRCGCVERAALPRNSI